MSRRAKLVKQIFKINYFRQNKKIVKNKINQDFKHINVLFHIE